MKYSHYKTVTTFESAFQNRKLFTTVITYDSRQQNQVSVPSSNRTGTYHYEKNKC